MARPCTASLQLNGASLALPSVTIITDFTTTHVIFSFAANVGFGHAGNRQLMGLQRSRYPDETIRLCRYENDGNGICNIHVVYLLVVLLCGVNVIMSDGPLWCLSLRQLVF